MIFMTVGSMLPFDRLVVAMDQWAAAHPETKVFAQIGGGTFRPSHMTWVQTLSRQEFDEHTRAATLIVAHAGIGSVVTALELRKPIVVLPRHAATKEHTTDHQIDTAKWMRGRSGVFVAMTEDELPAMIEAASATPVLPEALSPSAPPEFIAKIRDYLTKSLNNDKSNGGPAASSQP